MPIALLLSFCLAPVVAAVQTAPPPAPAAVQPAQPRAARPAARTTMVITVTDPKGATLPGIHVEALGVADRSGDTDESGTLRFTNLRAGAYRLRFTGDAVIPFEREVTVRAGQVADVDVTLNPAPEEASPPEPAEPPAPAPPPAGPPGEPETVSVLTLLEKELIRREPRKETPLGCSGNARATLVQINEQQPERLYEHAELHYYIIGGEGTLRVDGRESAITTSDFVQIPRGTSHAFIRKGKRPLIMLALLSGEPCGAQ